MKGRIVEKKNLKKQRWLISIELTPFNQIEEKEIEQMLFGSATDDIKILIAGYLISALDKKYSIVRLVSQKIDLFTLIAYQN